MISPLSPTRKSLPEETSLHIEPRPYHLSHPASTLSSMNCHKGIGTILGGIREFFNFIFIFFKWALCCGCCKEKKGPSKIELPTHLPEGLSKDDPFAKIVFNTEGKIRNQEGFNRISDLFSALGTTSYGSWIWHKNALLEKEKKLREFEYHPLEFLYMIFWSKESTEWIANYKEQAILGAWILSLKTKRDPWVEFLSSQARNFNRRKDEVPAAVEGFCKALKLDFEKVQDFTTKKEWEGLIQFILEQRLKIAKN